MFQAIKSKIIDNFLYKISIKKRLIFYFILSVLIPTILISTTIYARSTAIIEEKISSSMQKNMNTTEAIIIQKLDSAKDISTLIIFNLNSKVLDILNRPNSDSIEALANEMTTFDDIITSYSLQSITDLTKVSIYPKIYMLNRPGYNQFKFSDKVFDYGAIENEPWVKDFPNGTFIFVGLNKIKTISGTIETIRFARKVQNLKAPTPTYAGLLTIDIEAEYFNEILESFKSSVGSSVFIVDGSNTVILSNNKAMIGKKLSELEENIQLDYSDNKYNSYKSKIDGKSILVSTNRIQSLKWNIVALSPLSELNRELTSFQNIVYIVLLVCMGISLFTALFLASNIAKPIQKLVRSMSAVKDGNFEIHLVYKRNDEFSFLINEYKRMISEIKELIQKLYISELDRQNAELKAKDAELKILQEQINPHFLYNTLDSVNWLAIKHNAPDISLMVKSLSNFFRYSLNKGRSIILWDDEIKQVESYLNIQKVRFRDRLDFEIAIQPEIYGNYTVKLILQPIVENAIKHGIEMMVQEEEITGIIRITGCVENGIIKIIISDNGVGADIEALAKLLSDPKNYSSFFGLKNVNLRIKHFFGDAYGISFIKSELKGVSAVVKVPVKKEIEEDVSRD